MAFGRTPKPPPLPPTRAELVVKLDSIQPGPGGARHLAPEDVTGVIDLALERLQHAQDAGSVVLLAATERLLGETEATRVLAKRLSSPPPPAPPYVPPLEPR